MYDSEVLEYWGKTCRFDKRSKLGYVFCFQKWSEDWVDFYAEFQVVTSVGAKSLFTFIPFLPPKRIVEREKHV